MGGVPTNNQFMLFARPMENNRERLDFSLCNQMLTRIKLHSCTCCLLAIQVPDEGLPPLPRQLGSNMEFVSWSFC